jgi:hypothetical protein
MIVNCWGDIGNESNMSHIGYFHLSVYNISIKVACCPAPSVYKDTSFDSSFPLSPSNCFPTSRSDQGERGFASWKEDTPSEGICYAIVDRELINKTRIGMPIKVAYLYYQCYFISISSANLGLCLY